MCVPAPTWSCKARSLVLEIVSTLRACQQPIAPLPCSESVFAAGLDGSPYYQADDNYYQWEGAANEYETVGPPPDVRRQAAGEALQLHASPSGLFRRSRL